MWGLLGQRRGVHSSKQSPNLHLSLMLALVKLHWCGLAVTVLRTNIKQRSLRSEKDPCSALYCGQPLFLPEPLPSQDLRASVGKARATTGQLQPKPFYRSTLQWAGMHLPWPGTSYYHYSYRERPPRGHPTLLPHLQTQCSPSGYVPWGKVYLCSCSFWNMILRTEDLLASSSVG